VEDTIVTIRYTDLDAAHRALRRLKALDREGELPVREAALERISRDLEPGVTIVIAEIAAPDPGVLGAVLEELGGTVTTRAAANVYAELRIERRSALHG
jgi:SpoVK/Ycf46/Vps4 family AAA+-type ATPase